MIKSNSFVQKLLANETPEQKASRELIQSISKLPHQEAKSTKEVANWLDED